MLTVKRSLSYRPSWMRFSRILLPLLPLALCACATNGPQVCVPQKPMPESLKQVVPQNRVCQMQQILGESCDPSAPIF